MALPEWKFISKYGPQVLSHLPEVPGMAIAEVDEGGVVMSVNRRGMASWKWKEGQRVPNAILIALSEVKEGGSVVLPVKPGGQALLGVRMEGGRGWLLIGYSGTSEMPSEKASPFRSLIEKMPALVVRMDGDGVVRYVNAAAPRLTGYSAEEIIGRPFWLETVHPEDRWKLMGALRRAVEGEAAVVGVRYLTRRQGPRFAEMHLFPTDPAEGEVQVDALAFDVTERSEVEEALFQSEALYRTFLEQSPIGMLHLDVEGTVTFENHQFRQIVGESVEDAWIGRSLFEIDGLDRHLRPLVRQMLDRGEAFHGEEALYQGPSGRAPQHLLINGSPIRHPEGGIVGGVLMIEDVTPQKQRDEELHLRHRYGEAESSLRRAALSEPTEEAFLREAATILGRTIRADRLHLLLANEDGRCASHAVWIDDLGASPEPETLVIELDDHPLLKKLAARHRMLHAHRRDTAAAVLNLLGRTDAAEAIWAPFYEGSFLAGFVLAERMAPPGETGAPTWVAAEPDLIEQLVRLFEALWSWTRVGNRYRRIVSTIEDVLFNFVLPENSARRYLFVTPQIETLTGYTHEEVSGSGERIDWLQLLHPEDRSVLDEHDERLRSGKESRVIYRVRHRDGTLRWLREHGTPQGDPVGRVTVSGILTDVTEQKSAEAVLMEAKQQAESANHLKSAFIATMSHEIRTPMGAVNGFAELLGRELSELEEDMGRSMPPQITEFVRAIRENSQKLLSLVNDLFDLSNLEGGSVKLRRISIPLHEVVMRSTSKVAVTLSQKGVDLRMDLDPSEPIVLGDPPRLEQVLDSLLSNAAKFTEDGSVTVRTRRRGNEVAIEVIDTGVGIAEEYLDRLFMPFMQEDNRLNRRFEGTGLGLALVKRLLDLMGGRIEVESIKGAGTTFRLLLHAAGVTAEGREHDADHLWRRS